VAADPLLRSGREVYLARCVSCHGPNGRGDGPLAKHLAGPKVGDLTSDRWKHGDAPAQVTAVVADGVPNSTMPGWGRTLSADEMKGVVAYVYHLSGRTVPDQRRGP
jgi:mono/diheme cytochrome c family protein